MHTHALRFPQMLGWAAPTRVPARRAPRVPARRAPAHTPYAAIDAYVEAQRRRLHMPGVALAIVVGNQIVHLRGFGKARPDGELPGPQTPFGIGSLTKSITAVAVMQLVEAGTLELDAPVQRYLPWFRVADPAASARITVRHLLNQTSGLPTSAGETALADVDARPDAAERQARALRTLALSHPVGTACEYSNANYNLLGLIIEAVSGEPYPDYVQTHIFARLDMRHTATAPSITHQHGLARGYRYWFARPVAAPTLPMPRGSLPSGQLVSCAEDMAHYLIAYLNGGRYGDAHILSHASIDEIQRGVADYRKMGISAGAYGMGWFISPLGRTTLAWHGGTLPDFGAYMALLPAHNTGVILLCNASHHWLTPVVTEWGTGVAALLAGERYRPHTVVRLIPWMLRSLLLIPALQSADVVATLRLLRRWHHDPERRPRGRRAWGRQLLLPLIPHLCLAGTLRPMLSQRRGYLLRYMPDCAWIALVCGSFSLGWSVVRSGLVLRALRPPSSPLGAGQRGGPA